MDCQKKIKISVLSLKIKTLTAHIEEFKKSMLKFGENKKNQYLDFAEDILKDVTDSNTIEHMVKSYMYACDLMSEFEEIQLQLYEKYLEKLIERVSRMKYV